MTWEYLIPTAVVVFFGWWWLTWDNRPRFTGQRRATSAEQNKTRGDKP